MPLRRAGREVLACHTLYWKDSALHSDLSYVGDDGCPEPQAVSREYLDCLCPDGWVEAEGSGNEEGLEAAADALSRGVEDPPSACWEVGSSLSASDESSVDLWRFGIVRAVWILSDEGDSSWRVPATDASPYVDLFHDLGGARVSTVGPHYADRDGSCLNGAQTWGVERYQDAADRTSGAYLAITGSPDEGCAEVSVGVILGEGMAADLE